ncbi:MAG TPA: DUF177 domain-containing protein [Candidatus Koribacter sp.]
MLIRIKDLELRPLEFNEAFEPGLIELGNELRQVAPLSTSGKADLIEENRGHKNILDDIRLVGKLATEVESACARCLEPVRQPVTREFELLYRPQGADKTKEEAAVSKGETEISYYEGDGLLLEDVLREQVLLAVPYRLLCQENCKGLCPSCGRNLNSGTCSCEEARPDPRWNPLGGLRDKLKSN